MLDKDKSTDNKISKDSGDKKALVVDNSTNAAEKKSTATDNVKADNAKAKKADSNKKPFASTSTKAPVQKAARNSPNSVNTISSSQQKVSKLAVLALLISGIAVAGSIGHYVWQQQQASLNTTAQHNKTTQALQDNSARIKQELSAVFSSQLQNQQQFNAQLKKYTQQASTINQDKITLLNNKVILLEQSLQQREPSDWLIHEAEYLIRIAARTMWLEQDTKAAMGLLKEADHRLAELQQPKYLPIRALIHQDIETLALMPTLDNQNAILSLMALNKQVSTLPLAGVDLTKTIGDSAPENVALSDDINDWKSNLRKTWDKLFNDFIVVRRRTGTVEPLMAPEQQAHLKQNLSLKIQLAQWAASEQKSEIYQQTLLDIQEWLHQFFDMNDAANEIFYQALEQSKQHLISYDYPSDLASLHAIKHLINQSIKPIEPTEKNVTDETAQDKRTDNVPKSTTKEESTPDDKIQPVTVSEGNI
jgi:uroporphyrin-3 C-methyltransferase